MEEKIRELENSLDETFNQIAISGINGSHLVISSSKNNVGRLNRDLKSILKNKDVRRLVGLNKSKFDGGKYIG